MIIDSIDMNGGNNVYSRNQGGVHIAKTSFSQKT